MKKAVLLLGHGSRRSEASSAMWQVADILRGSGAYDIVQPAYMSFNRPSIPEAIDSCVAMGAERIIMAPYFLHMGAHVTKDLPAMMEDGRQRHPGVEIVLGQHIGFHPKIAEIVQERIAEVDA